MSMENNTRPFYGKRIRMLRIYYDYSLDDLAKVLGITRQSIHFFETGQRSPQPVVEAGMCQMLKVPENFFRRDSVVMICDGNDVKIVG